MCRASRQGLSEQRREARLQQLVSACAVVGRRGRRRRCILPTMVNDKGDNGEDIQGFLHDTMVPILGTGDEPGGRYAVLDASDSELAHSFRSAYAEMQAAAAFPETGALADPFVQAGLKT